MLGEILKSVVIKDDNNNSQKIDADIILGFFGLIMQLGPIAEWGLNMNKKTIEVNTKNLKLIEREFCGRRCLRLSWEA